MRVSELWRGFRRGETLATHELDANGVLRLPSDVGVTVRVEVGQVVVTRAGDPEDHVIEAGAVMVLDPHASAMAWALLPSRVEVRTWSERSVVPATPLFAR